MIVGSEISFFSKNSPLCVCVCLCACMHACVRACVRVCEMYIYTCRKADQMLQELKQPQCLSDSLMDQSCSLLEISEIASPLSLDQTLTLRVRCRGKIYRFTVNKVCLYCCTIDTTP